MRARLAGTALAWSVLLAACETGARAPASAATTLALSAEPLLRVESTATPFHQVTGAFRLSDGGVLVANEGSRSLLRFARDGTLAAEMGGPGSGPGEFHGMAWAHRARADTVAIFDPQLGRLSLWGPAGHAGGVTLQPPGGRPALAVGRLPDGRIVAESRAAAGTKAGVQRDSLRYTLHAADGRLLGELARRPGSERFVKVMAGDRSQGVANYDLPFGLRRLTRVWGDRVVTGDGGTAALEVLSSEGLPGAALATPFGVRETTDADRDANRGFFLSFARDDAARAAIEADIADIPVAARVPAYGALFVDARGRLWVGEYPMPGAAPRRWAILDADGRVAGILEVPVGFTPTDAGDGWVLGVARAPDTDEESVVLYGLGTAR